MIFNKLGETHIVDKPLFKSFQPSGSHEFSKVSSNVSTSGAVADLKKIKKSELFRSNVETPNSALLLHHPNNHQLSHKDYLNESIKQSSSNDEDEIVAEER